MLANNPDLITLIERALAEDIGEGDHSTLSCIPAHQWGEATLKIKEDGILAGMEFAAAVFLHLSPAAHFAAHKKDGDPMQAGETAFVVSAPVHTILQAERLVLNGMQRMSGIATLTHQYSQILAPFHTRLLDTRKTTPNFRLLEKEAVRIGGGTNHRMGLYDMIMLKDNHIDYCGGLEQAIEKAHAYVQQLGRPLAIEVETRSLADVETVCQCGQGKVFRIMLDNFEPAAIVEAMALVQGRFQTEASGGINLENVLAYAATGVDYVSVGGLIHQARSLDLSLKASFTS